MRIGPNILLRIIFSDFEGYHLGKILSRGAVILTDKHAPQQIGITWREGLPQPFEGSHDSLSLISLTFINSINDDVQFVAVLDRGIQELLGKGVCRKSGLATSRGFLIQICEKTVVLVKKLRKNTAGDSEEGVSFDINRRAVYISETPKLQMERLYTDAFDVLCTARSHSDKGSKRQRPETCFDCVWPPTYLDICSRKRLQ